MEGSSNPFEGMSRQQAVWAACDQLAAEGIKPSLRQVKRLHPRGSDSDVQQDVNGWYDYVFEQHCRRLVVPGLPDDLVRSLEQWWENACALARSQFESDRNALQAQVRAADERVEVLEGALDQAKTGAANEALARKSVEDQLAHVMRHEDELEHALRASEERYSALEVAAARDEHRLRDEIRAVSERAQARERELRDDFDSRLRSEAENTAALKASYDDNQRRTAEHYRVLEAQYLQETDRLRQQMRGREEQIEKMTQKSREHFDAMSTLRSEIGALKAERAGLASLLNEERAQRDRLQTELVQLVAGNAALQTELNLLKNGLLEREGRDRSDSD